MEHRAPGHRVLSAIAVAATVIAIAGCGSSNDDAAASGSSGAAAAGTEVQLLGFNDFHGRLEAQDSLVMTDDTGAEIPAGGVEYLATHLQQARTGQAHSITAAAGDLTGATPFLSAAFRDEPTLAALDALELEVSSVGNHEFDAGLAELHRRIDGGCPEDGCPEDGCPEGEQPWSGIGIDYLGANVVHAGTDDPALPATWVKDFGDGTKVGFIGMTLEGTAAIVSKSATAGVEFRDEVETANRYAAQLTDSGVNAIVVLLHEGGSPTKDNTGIECDTFSGEAGISGPVIDIAERLDPSVDVMLTGHTHKNYVCSIPDPAGNPRLVTSAESYGRLYTDIRATYNPETNDFDRATVDGSNVLVDRIVAKDPAETEIIDRYSVMAGEIGKTVVGYVGGPMTRDQSPAGESALAEFIADVQLDVTSEPDTGGAQLAVMNPGGVRDDLVPGADGAVTYEQIYNVQPFSNTLTTMDLTGAQILDALRAQWFEPADPMILQWSAGLTYAIDPTKSGAEQLIADSVHVLGAPLDPARVYRVTMNSFLGEGGDNFEVFAAGTNRLTGPIDLDAAIAWFGDSTDTDDVAPVPATDRITVR